MKNEINYSKKQIIFLIIFWILIFIIVLIFTDFSIISKEKVEEKGFVTVEFVFGYPLPRYYDNFKHEEKVQKIIDKKVQEFLTSYKGYNLKHRDYGFKRNRGYSGYLLSFYKNFDNVDEIEFNENDFIKNYPKNSKKIRYIEDVTSEINFEYLDKVIIEL